MLDRDLAALYGVENRVLKQAVRRNIDRFPFDSMLVLSKMEFQSLKSQNVILKRGQNFFRQIEKNNLFKVKYAAPASPKKILRI
jgi:hypothetical protein